MKLPFQPRLARNQYSGLELGPTHASLRSLTTIRITTSNSSVKRSGTPNQLLGVGLHTIAMSGLSRVRTELFQLLIIPSLAPHPVQTNSEFPRHRYLGDLPSPPHGQMKVLTAPFREAAHRDLGSFHQQETQHRTPLLGDMPQPSPIPAGVFQRHQSQIAGHLLATLKPIRFPDDQHEGQ